ncbi:MAG: sigma-70 family RNA polymerase sigma factor [Planctomycetes bacterium]|nr:sigma-70 family RNA polymerase sigma factor [Planctomycetota bacterium]
MPSTPAEPREPDEFEALLAPHMGLISGYALKLTRNRPDADDVVQESVYRALRGFAGFQRGTNFRAWMLKIITNTFLQRCEREGRRGARQLDEEAVADGHAASDGADVRALFAFGWEAFADQLDEGLKEGLEQLPDEFRLPLLLSSLAGLSHQEIARAMGTPVGTVMSRLFRARQRLQQALRAHAERRAARERSS